MNIHQLDVFSEIVETGSMSAAAKALHVSTPSVTQMVHKLEEELGTELLDRDKRSAVPTEAGMRFYSYAKNVRREHRQLMNDMNIMTRTPIRHLSIGISNKRALSVLPDIVSVLQQRFPEIRLTVRDIGGVPDAARRALVKGELDVCFTNENIHDARLVREVLLHEQLSLIVAKGSKAEKELFPNGIIPMSVGPEILSRAPLIMQQSHRRLERILESMNFKPNVVISVDNNLISKQYAAMGLGCSISSELVSGGRIASNVSESCHVIPIDHPDSVSELSMIYPKDPGIANSLKVFIDIAKETLAHEGIHSEGHAL